MYPLTRWSLGRTLMFVIGIMAVVFAASAVWCLYLTQSARMAAWVLGGNAVAILAVWLLVTIHIERGVLAPLQEIAATIARIEREADLTLRLPVRGNADLAQVAGAVNSLLKGFAASVAEVRGNAECVADASSTVASSSSRLAAQTAAQSEAAASTAAAVEQMTARIAQVRDSASEVRSSSTENHELSEQGGSVIGSAATEMTNIAEAVRAASSSVAELGRHSDQISDIVHVIKEIADQTNLLALNAAIEAARAGEQGRGFAVVADEVRRLAERTASSTGEISSMIERIQSGVRHTTETMETGVVRVDHGVTLARQAGTAIAQIHDGAGKVSTAVSDISGALCEQAAAGTDISRRVEIIAQMSAKNTAAVQSSAQAAESAAQAAMALTSVVNRYRIGAQA